MDFKMQKKYLRNLSPLKFLLGGFAIFVSMHPSAYCEIVIMMYTFTITLYI